MANLSFLKRLNYKINIKMSTGIIICFNNIPKFKDKKKLNFFNNNDITFLIS